MVATEAGGASKAAAEGVTAAAAKPAAPQAATTPATKAAAGPTKLKGLPDSGSGWAIMKSLSGYLWPKDNPAIKRRVLVAVALLVGSKARTHSLRHDTTRPTTRHDTTNDTTRHDTTHTACSVS
jgi:nucleoid-associated protein YgaU